MVLGPHRRCQTVLHIIGISQRLFIGAEFLNCHYRAKDLALDVLVLLLQARQYGCLKEVPLVANLRSTGFYGRVVRKTINEALHALKLVYVVHWAEQNVFAAWITGLSICLNFGN